MGRISLCLFQNIMGELKAEQSKKSPREERIHEKAYLLIILLALTPSNTIAFLMDSLKVISKFLILPQLRRSNFYYQVPVSKLTMKKDFFNLLAIHKYDRFKLFSRPWQPWLLS